MYIALMSHDNKKDLMVQFCTAYAGILSQHNLCATSTTGQMVMEATGLHVHRFLTCQHGGSQQIGARPLFASFFVEGCFVPPLRGGGALFLFYLCRLAGGRAFFSRERKEAKGRLRNYVP